MKRILPPGSVKRCMKCKSLFGTRFTNERVVYDRGSLVVCKDCSQKIDAKKLPAFCAHCRIKLEQNIPESQQHLGAWYCDVCIQEIKERNSPFGDPLPQVINDYNNIRRLRNMNDNYRAVLRARKDRLRTQWGQLW